MFENYTNCLFKDIILLKSKRRFKNDYHNVCTEPTNKVALSSNDDKRLQTFDKTTKFPYGTNAFRVSETEMLNKI